MKARSARAKGSKLERWVVDELKSIGVRARKQPGSGIYDSFPHDVSARIAGTEWIVECKHWKEGWRTGDKAMGAADMLIIKPNHQAPRVYMHWSMFKSLCDALQASESDDLPTPLPTSHE